MPGSGREKKSKVWKFYIILPDGKNVQCILCGKHLVYSSTSTTSLRRHILVKHKQQSPELFSDGDDPVNASTNIHFENKETTTAATTSFESMDSSSFNQVQQSETSKKKAFWKYIRVLPDTSKAVCEICGMVLAHNPLRTTNLKKHILSKHTSIMGQISNTPDSGDAVMDKKPPIVNHVEPAALPVIKGNFVKSPAVVANLPQVKKKAILDEKVVEMIAFDLQPVAIVESKGFINFLAFSNPGYTPPSRKVVSKELLPNLYKRTMEQVLKKMESISHVALTTELWTNQGQESYLSVTAHYISPSEWLAQSVLLATVAFMGTPSGRDISCELQRIVAEWNLLEKVTVMVTDNETNTLLANEQLPWAYIPCFGHLIHLVVMNALSADEEAMVLIQKLNDIVNFFQHNHLANQSLAATQKELNLPENKLIYSIHTRWNSIFYMLERMYEQLDAVNTVLELHDMRSKCLSDQDANNMKILMSSLKPFKVAVTSLCSDKSCCISVALPLVKGLLKMMTSVTEAKEPLTQHLIDGLIARFSKIEEIEWIATATLLDPRFKRYEFAEKNVIDKATESVVAEISAWIEPVQENSLNTSEPSASDTFWDYLDVITGNGEAKKQAQIPPSANRELQCYLDATPIPRKEDALFYWKQHKEVLPNLYKVALKYLSVPITAIPTDRLFTKDEDSFFHKTCRIKSKHINMILFLNRNM